MNFIQRLKAENETKQATIDNVRMEIFAIRAMLQSDKFVGFESDGSRKDWIATGDVMRLLDGLNEKLLG